MPSLAYLAVFVIFLDSSYRIKPLSIFQPEHNATADGAQLIRSTGSNETLLECRYSDSDVCSYSQGNGSIQSGSGTCPPSIDPSTSTDSTEYECKQHHLQNSPLIGSSVTSTAGNLACVYADATLCTYSKNSGTLSTGAGVCPPAALGSPACPVSSPTATGSDSKAVAAVLASSDTSKTPLSPALIALLVLNSLLVFVVLAIAGTWLKRWHSSADSKYHSLRLGTMSMNNIVDGGADEVPLTHGAPGRYPRRGWARP
ncbi:hypothetical protein B0H14DRAFT_3870672 [Mycena olivaceomarginata]|nr:hypothetical protein B0H14DRAFT_3870672 [Mycena olivaceomarginata]